MASASLQHCSVEEAGVAKTWEMSLSVPTIWSHGFSIQRFLCSFAQPRVSDELSDWQNVFAIPRFRFFEVLFHISYYYWAKESLSLYRGLRYIEARYIEVLLYTCPTHPHPIYIILNTCTFSLRGVSILVHLWVGEGVEGRINNAAIYTQICIYHRRPCSHVKQTKNR